MGWNVFSCDGHDAADVARALAAAQTSDKPVLIATRTVIGFGAPTRAGTSKAHGEALGAEEIAGAREKLGWPYPPFVIPDDILSDWRAIGARGKAAREAWIGAREIYIARDLGELRCRNERTYPRLALRRRLREFKKKMSAERPSLATRKASENVLEIDQRACGEDDRRLGRSYRLQQHAHQSDEGDRARRLHGPFRALRHPRARHGGRHERAGAAWRRHSLFRHVPRFLRLLPSRDPARGADGSARHSCDDT